MIESTGTSTMTCNFTSVCFTNFTSVSQKILITIVAGKMIKYVNCRDNSTNQCITKIQIAVFFRKTFVG